MVESSSAIWLTRVSPDSILMMRSNLSETEICADMLAGCGHGTNTSCGHGIAWLASDCPLRAWERDNHQLAMAPEGTGWGHHARGRKRT